MIPQTSARRTRWTPLAVATSALLLGAGLLIRLSCAPKQDTAARSPDEVGAAAAQGAQNESAEAKGAEQSEATTAPSATHDRGSAPPVPSSRDDDAVALPAVAATAQASADSRDTAPAHGTYPRIDARELPLLADIERELSRDPPPEVHGLLAEYRRGKDRAALVEYVQREFPDDLPLRVIALRWIDDVRPGDSGGRETRPRAPGGGTGASWVGEVRQKR